MAPDTLSTSLVEDRRTVEKSAITWHGQAIPQFAYDAAAAELADRMVDNPSYAIDPIMMPVFRHVFLGEHPFVVLLGVVPNRRLHIY